MLKEVGTNILALFNANPLFKYREYSEWFIFHFPNLFSLKITFKTFYFSDGDLYVNKYKIPLQSSWKLNQKIKQFLIDSNLF